MKLQNKKNGYVTNWCIDKDVIRTCDGSIVYNSLAELNAEWEDYKPKEYWAVDWSCSDWISTFIERNDDIDDFNKSIGNYFNTREEAEKAVEKLKAWKRLKDKGFKWLWYNSTPTGNSVDFYIDDWDKEATRDITLLFGGEE